MASSSDLPSIMKSWVIVKNGAPATALQLDTSAPVPVPQGSNVLVKVSYASINPADVRFMKIIPTFVPFRRRPTPGLDFCGTVAALGPSIPATCPVKLDVGSVVCGAIPAGRVAMGVGSLSEYICIPAESLALKPDVLSEAAAAGLGISGQMSASVMREAKVEPGHRILLNGASGGVGTILCQILTARGGVVSAVCSGAGANLVRRLGAHEVIDYTLNSPLFDYLETEYEDKPFDLIIDCVGNQMLYDNCKTYLKPEGLFISIVGGESEGVVPWVIGNLWPKALGGTPRRYKILPLSPRGELQREVVQWVNDGNVQEVVLDSEFPMDDVVKALEKIATRRAKGKIVVQVSE